MPLPSRLTRSATTVIGGMIALNVAVASGAVASHGFSDVPSGAYYHDAVEWARVAGITAGCTTDKYCPEDPVSRGQMAVFLQKMDKRGFAGTRLYSATATVVGNGTNTTGYVLAACPTGHTLVGGGFLQQFQAQARVLGSFPENHYVSKQDQPARWAVMYQNLPQNETIGAFATCLRPE